jgi:hypothetical protein
MKRFLGAAFILASLLAFSQPGWADPAPSQIQAEMAAGQWQQAHNDLVAVLRDHPDSIKARTMLADVDTQLARRNQGSGTVPLTVPPQRSSHGGLIGIVLVVVGVWFLFRILRARQQRAMAGGMYGAPGYGAPGQPPFGPGPGPGGPSYNPNMYPPQPPAAGGSMLGGLGAGLLGGVIAEEMLGNRNQPVNETIINENGNNAGNDGWDNNTNNDNADWSQQADNWNDDDNNSWT